MALSAAPGPLLCRLPANSRALYATRTSLSFSLKTPTLISRKSVSIRASSASAAPTSGCIAPAISLSDKALSHLNKMRAERNEDLRLRIGVKQGGCSGMSYIMEFENQANARPDDSVMEYNGFMIDRLAMENCSGVVVASAIFGDHDKLRQPKGLGAQTLETVCFFMFIDDITLKSLHSHKVLSHIEGEADLIGAWRIVQVSSSKLPYDNPAMNGVIPKHLIHRFFPNAKFSVWVDAKMQLTVDPLLLIHSLVISKDVDMALSKHPFNVHTMEEAMATARWRKWGDVESLRLQMETYCENGLQPWTPSKLPYTTDVPDTALIARKHGVGSDLFSCLLFNELEAFNPRDQLSFAYVRDLMTPKIKINMFEVDVFEQVAVEYRHNIKREGPPLAPQKIRRASTRNISTSSCEGYLLKMWGETNDLEN